MPIQVLNGANLGRLGTREPAVYGTTSYAQLEVLCESAAAHLGVAVQVRQTDSEAEMLGWLHLAADSGDAVLLNAGAWSHTSIALGDACAALSGPLVEVHMTNIYAREEFRHHSYISAHAVGVICGLGVDGYLLGLRWLSAHDGG
ncbi:MAG: 3-dehydroquinate dehydratase [Geodermatophilaceae bacterium]|nr:3-dehydroquinate dehydratase [Geodermatophilaceae bacterium]